jgi:hypothetical protein
MPPDRSTSTNRRQRRPCHRQGRTCSAGRRRRDTCAASGAPQMRHRGNRPTALSFLEWGLRARRWCGHFRPKLPSVRRNGRYAPRRIVGQGASGRTCSPLVRLAGLSPKLRFLGGNVAIMFLRSAMSLTPRPSPKVPSSKPDEVSALPPTLRARMMRAGVVPHQSGVRLGGRVRARVEQHRAPLPGPAHRVPLLVVDVDGRPACGGTPPFVSFPVREGPRKSPL